MYLEILPAGGFGRAQPLVIEAAQVVVRNGQGTVIAVAAEYGPDRTQVCSMAGQPDFETVLRNLGIYERVACEVVTLSRPQSGARLLAGPRGA